MDLRGHGVTTVEQLKPEVRGRVEPVVGKWTAFAGELSGQIDEVLAEADADLDALIQQHVTDHGPIAAALSAARARFAGLHPKLDDAFQEVEGLYDEAIGDAYLDEHDLRAVYDVRDRLLHERQELAERLELAYEELHKRKSADWARRLPQLAAQERQQGLGVHALAHEAAWNEWLAERRARARFYAYRHPTQPDFDEYLKAARAYWTRYYRVGKELHPELCEDIAAAVEAELRRHTAWDPDVDRAKHDFFARLVAAARAEEYDEVRRLASSAPAGIHHSDCAECLIERGLLDGTIAVLDAQYDAADEDDPRGRWIAEQLAGIRQTVSRQAPPER